MCTSEANRVVGGDNGKTDGHVECMGEQLENQGRDGRIQN
jgi:hypothetical protein